MIKLKYHFYQFQQVHWDLPEERLTVNRNRTVCLEFCSVYRPSIPATRVRKQNAGSCGLRLYSQFFQHQAAHAHYSHLECFLRLQPALYHWLIAELTTYGLSQAVCYLFVHLPTGNITVSLIRLKEYIRYQILHVCIAKQR